MVNIRLCHVFYRTVLTRISDIIQISHTEGSRKQPGTCRVTHVLESSPAISDSLLLPFLYFMPDGIPARPWVY